MEPVVQQQQQLVYGGIFNDEKCILVLEMLSTLIDRVLFGVQQVANMKPNTYQTRFVAGLMVLNNCDRQFLHQEEDRCGKILLNVTNYYRYIVGCFLENIYKDMVSSTVTVQIPPLTEFLRLVYSHMFLFIFI